VAFKQSEIMSKPELFVEPDPDLPLALLDQKEVFCCNFLSLHIMQNHFNPYLPGNFYVSGW
jgi:hypothetical protein